MTILPVGEWLPDQADFGNKGSTVIQNVVPRTKDSYGPMPTPVVYSGALTARCQGSYSFVDSTEAPHVFAGDATKLYQMTAGSAPNFSDVSRVVAVPAAPTLTDVAGGALAGVTYFVKVTYTNAQGETTASAEANRAVAVNRVLKVTSPIASTGATGYNVYVSLVTGTETKQTVAAITLGTDWTEPTSGLIAGSALPSSNTADIPYTTGSPVNPTAPTIPAWCMTSFGERIIATNYSDAPQTFLVGTDTQFSALATAAPNARYVAVIRDFVVFGYTSDGVSGVQPRRIWWCAVGNPLSWPTPGTASAIQVQSDYQDLQQSDLGQITGLIGGHLASADGAAFMERGIYRLKYVGASGGIFDIQVAEGAAGTQSPLSIVQRRAMGNTAVAFYYGEDGWQAFDGMSSIAIGVNKIDRRFANDLDPAYLSAIQGVADPILPLVYWLYHAGTAGSLYDRLLVYNTVLGRWAVCDLTATPAEWITRSLSIGQTLDALDIFGSLDAVPAPLSSGVWSGNRPRISLFDSSHKLNTMAGAAMAATVDTSEIQPFPGFRSRINLTRPLVEGGSSPSVAIGTRERPEDAVVYHAAVPMSVIGHCPQRVTGRYVRARITIPAASTWTHIQGVDGEATREGRR